MQTDREQSEFNMAFAWLARLNYWFWSSNESKFNNDVYGWCKSLLILFDELTTEMLDEERTAKLAELKTLYGEVNKLISKPQQQTGIPPELYWQLSEIERWLRHLANKAGLLKKTKEDPGLAMTE